MNNSQVYNAHHVMPDLTGLLLVAGSWVPTLNIITVSFIFKMVMCALSAALTVLAIIDYAMKISWKLKLRRKSKN